MRTELSGLKKAFKELPHIAGNAAVEVSQKSFAQEKFADKGKSSKWAPRKKDGGGTRGSRRGLLVDTNELQKSIGYEAIPGQVAIGTDKVYAQVNNEGGRAGRGAGFIMPKRQFMGNSPEIDNEIEKYLDDEMDKLFG